MLAGFAAAAGIHHAAYGSEITRLEILYVAADICHPSDNFMTGNTGIDGIRPLIADGMQVGMADTAEKNVELYILRTRFAAIE